MNKLIITEQQNLYVDSVIIWKDKSITYEGFGELDNNNLPTAKVITKSLKTEFNDWIEDGNVTKTNGYFSTQDSQWRNKIKSEKDLFKYYVKQFIIPTL